MTINKDAFERITTVIDALAQCQILSECWQEVCKYLDNFGFDRVFYARKARVDLSERHNLTGSLVLSTYGAQVDDVLVHQRGYIHNDMVQWSLQNTGARSWQVSRDRYRAGHMTPEEEHLYLATRKLGIIAGFTYAPPKRADGSASGLGLCYRAGFEQPHVDQIWQEHSAELIAVIQTFDIAVSRFPHFDEREALSEFQVQVLRLASEGRTISEIADTLSVHRRTVDNAMTQARALFGVGTTLQAVLRADQQGQI